MVVMEMVKSRHFGICLTRREKKMVWICELSHWIYFGYIYDCLFMFLHITSLSLGQNNKKLLIFL